MDINLIYIRDFSKNSSSTNLLCVIMVVSRVFVGVITLYLFHILKRKKKTNSA